MVLVPVSSLKKALIVLEEKKYCQTQLTLARDTIKNQSDMITNYDTIVNNQKTVITMHEQNAVYYKKVLTNKDKEVKHFETLYEKERKNKRLAIYGGSLLFVLSIIFL